MKAVGLSVLLLLTMWAGCFGPPPGPEADPLAPRTSVVVLPADGVDVREPACDPNGVCSEYYYVEIRGSENWTLVRGHAPGNVTCHSDWAYNANPSNHTVIYNASRYKFDGSLNTIVSEDFWGVRINTKSVAVGCPKPYGLNAYAASPFPSRTVTLGSYGVAKITVYRDGFMVFGEKYFVDLGKKVVVSYGRLRAADSNATYYVTGGFEVVNRGPWPLDQLYGAASGTVARGPG